MFRGEPSNCPIQGSIHESRDDGNRSSDPSPDISFSVNDSNAPNNRQLAAESIVRSAAMHSHPSGRRSAVTSAQKGNRRCRRREQWQHHLE